MFPAEETPCCDAPDIAIAEDGTRVCRHCGLTFGQEFVAQERRAFTAEDIRNRRVTEPRWSPFGPRTVITKVRIDAKGRLLPAKQQALFTRLRKIHGSLINSLERNYSLAKPRMGALGTKFVIPGPVVETAWKIYREVFRQRLTVGRSIEAFTCATLYAAIRIHEFPRMFDEISDASLVPVNIVLQALKLVIRAVLPPLNLKYKPIAPEPLIYRFGNDLNLSLDVQKRGASLLREASARGLLQAGKDPKGVAAAAIYLAARESSEYKAQAKIAEVAHVNEVTLRSSAKQINPRLSPSAQ